MQTVADAPQEPPAVVEPLAFLRGEESADGEVFGRRVAEVTLDDPADGLYVAQAAGRDLDVRLEVVVDVLIAVVTLALFVDLGAEEPRAGPDFVGGEQPADLAVEREGTGEQPALEDRCRGSDVFLRFLLALVDRSNAVADVQLEVPEVLHERLDPVAIFGGVAVDEDQQIDVGVRMQLAATVSADGEQRDMLAGAFRPFDSVPEVLDELIEELGAAAHDRFDVFAGPESL